MDLEQFRETKTMTHHLTVLDALSRQISELEAKIDRTPSGDNRDTLQAFHEELLDRYRRWSAE